MEPNWTQIFLKSWIRSNHSQNSISFIIKWDKNTRNIDKNYEKKNLANHIHQYLKNDSASYQGLYPKNVRSGVIFEIWKSIKAIPSKQKEKEIFISIDTKKALTKSSIYSEAGIERNFNLIKTLKL